MKKDNLHIPEIKKTFAHHKMIRKTELRDFYIHQYKALDQNTFRRILYSLEKENIVIKVDPGVYLLNNKNNEVWTKRKNFVPEFSSELKSINNSVQKEFPYTKTILWETRILHDFMLHQPGLNLTILETEKESIESIFNFLKNQFTGRVFLDPNWDMVEKYVLRNTDNILILPMISRSPHQRISGIPSPKLEKILVDIWADEEKFFMFHGQELVNIYEMAFQNFQVSERTFFWYARRRNVKQEIRAFIAQETAIKLIQQQGMNQ